jgi:hypothetical protein
MSTKHFRCMLNSSGVFALDLNYLKWASLTTLAEAEDKRDQVPSEWKLADDEVPVARDRRGGRNSFCSAQQSQERSSIGEGEGPAGYSHVSTDKVTLWLVEANDEVEAAQANMDCTLHWATATTLWRE